MMKFILAGSILLLPAFAFADLDVRDKEKSEESESSGGSLGTIEVLSIVTLAGASVYLTRKKKI